MRVIIDGVPVDEANASVSVFDWVVIRGFGAFEVTRSYAGALFRREAHLDRLERSTRALDITMPDRAALAADMDRLAGANPDGQVRVVVTGGGRDPKVVAPSRTIVMWEPLPKVPDRARVLPIVAPWHPATDIGGFPGIKWTSYAPNMATTDKVRRAGYDDALLMTPDHTVLEGPTFSYAWVTDGRLETPSLDLGILASITREVLFECATRLGLEIRQGHYPLARVIAADEVIALSTVKQVIPVAAIEDHPVPQGPLAGRIAGAFAAIVAEETGNGMTA